MAVGLTVVRGVGGSGASVGWPTGGFNGVVGAVDAGASARWRSRRTTAPVRASSPMAAGGKCIENTTEAAVRATIAVPARAWWSAMAAPMATVSQAPPATICIAEMSPARRLSRTR